MRATIREKYLTNAWIWTLMHTLTKTIKTTTTTMLLPWGDEQLATQRGEIRGRGRGGERRPNYTRYRPTSKEPTVALLSEPSPPNGRPENNAPLPRIPQSSGGRRRPDYAFDTLLPSLVSPLSLSSSYPSFTLRECSLLSLTAGSLAVAELASFASIIVILSDYHAHSSKLTWWIVEMVNFIYLLSHGQNA